MANPSLAKFKAFQAQARELLDEHSLPAEDIARLNRIQKLARFVILVIKHFNRNRCPVRAGALAYTTILALIPLLAVGISVASGLLQKKGDEANEQLYGRLIDGVVAKAAPQLGLMSQAPGEENDAQKEVVKQISQFINNIHSGALGVTGVIALVLVAISLLTTIEAAFNDMWGLRHGRNWMTRLVQYWAGITLGPLLILVALTLSTGPHFAGTKLLMEKMPYVGALLFAFTPFVVVCIAFMLFYLCMPNTKVDWQAAALGGLVGGCFWQLTNVLSILFVSRVIMYKEIYQSFAIVPVFMFGLYISWLIVLFGAQVAYTFQNRLALIEERLVEKVDQRGREWVALRLMTLIGQRFQRGETASISTALARDLKVPGRLIIQLAQGLAGRHLLVAVKDQEGAYAPARPLESMTVQDVLQAIRLGQGPVLETQTDAVSQLVRDELARIEQAEEKIASGVTVKSLVERAERLASGLGQG